MKKTEQLCQDIVANIGTKNAKAFTNVVISLSSYDSARSITELSESPLFHHQYSSIRDGIAGVGAEEEEQIRQLPLINYTFYTSLFPSNKS